MKIAVLMDDIANINPKKDSSLAMMLEAMRREWEIYTLDTTDLFANKNGVYAHASQTTVADNIEHWFEKQPSQIIALGAFDVILMRKDPPFDMNYIYATYFLEQAEKQGVLVVNKAQSLRDANEKLFALNFPHCLPKTLVSSNQTQINDFIKTQKIAVVKPLDGMGGHDIFKFKTGDGEINTTLKRLTNNGKQPIMAQEFLPEIAQGDKRILLINGKPIDYALARIPAKGNFKGNLAAGATGVGQPLSKHDYYLCKQIAPTLKAKGLLFVGLDVIGDYITEINVTSPTCIRELDTQFDLNIARVLFDVLQAKLQK
ncbi:glutathione synthase [Bathymodiolus heckerae thiotrophic gill symbiont]|uniref:glutathione synthase n=1 Tax=Bathymodiolus heckerae thiotrophic gill symbiont TaxID=1052212 RepID=UPI0010FDCD19|nr:glutathione synthase [Bathymodiolus heckerae thiotrophic gill symbiont]